MLRQNLVELSQIQKRAEFFGAHITLLTVPSDTEIPVLRSVIPANRS